MQASSKKPESPPVDDRWPDGSRRSTNNGFTHGMQGKPHGFVPGTVSDTPPKRVKNVRAGRAFGMLNGTMNDLGRKKAA